MTAVDLETFSFTITPPVYGSQCVTTYTIIPSVSGVTMATRDFVVEASSMEATITHMRDGFDLQCDNIYSFTVAANTAAGPGEMSRMVIPELEDSLLIINYWLLTDLTDVSILKYFLKHRPGLPLTGVYEGHNYGGGGGEGGLN